MSTETLPAQEHPPVAAPAAQETAEPSPWVLAACTATAMLLAALSLSSVFADWRWFPPTAAMIAVLALAGALLRSVPAMRATGSTVLVQFVLAGVLALYLTVSSAMPFGVPTPGAVAELFALLGAGVDDIYSTTAPAASTPGFTAILVVGIGLITILVDGLVSDLRAPKVSGILLLLLWVIPVLLAGTDLAWYHFAAVAGAFLLLMLSRYLSTSVRRAAAYSAVAGALALTLGAVLPIALPPVAQRPQQPLGQPEDISVVNPFLDLRNDLEQGDDSPVLEYVSDDPLAPPLRLTSVSAFDGRTWMPEPFDIDPFAVAADGLPRPDGLSSDTPVAERSADVRILGLDGQHLPAPYAPQSISGLERRWIFDPETLTIVGNGVLTTDAQYEVAYRSVEPTAEQLAEAPAVDAEEFETELALPADMPSVIADTADEVTAGSRSQWEAAVALQDWFRSGEFEYSLSAPAEASSSAIADFLADRRGYCVQFSGAMTAMARSLGIPARIGVGFTAGRPTGEGQYRVSLQEAHAWPELYFEGAGWVRFEPTPGGPAGDPPPWAVSSGTGEDEEAEETAEPTEEPSEDGAEAAPSAAPETPEDEAGPDEESGAEGLSAETLRAFAIAGLVLLVLFVLALPALLRLLQRRLRLTGRAGIGAGTHPRGELARAEGTWTEIAALSRDFGLGWDRARTLRAHEASLIADLDADAAERLRRVVDALEGARYAGAAAVGGIRTGAAPEPGGMTESGGVTEPGDGDPHASRRGQRTPAAAELTGLVRALRRDFTRRRGSPAAVRAALVPASLWKRG
ncbi:transglutaminaseTgpA domain-containing protein [Brevibacterium album]|uniref:transglutaminase family protein n=1 Tax=Brevibacterium album TaxID=417948 RepID=UPI0003FA1833|nr:DUF3488 and transglutaminase-like domain-containing protein [Brevibacterium album]